MASTPKSKLDAELPDKASLPSGAKAVGAEPDGSYGEDGDVNPVDSPSSRKGAARAESDASKPEKVQR